MPLTVSVSFVPFIEVTLKRAADAEPCSFAKPSSTIAPSAVRLAVRREVVAVEAPIVAGSTPLTPSCGRTRARRPGGTLLALPDAGDRRLDLGVDRRPAVGGGHDRRRLHAVLERAAALVLEALGDDGHRGHERDADHQRAGRGGGAAGVAHRVVAGERPAAPPIAAAGRPTSAADGAHAAGEQAHLRPAARIAQCGHGRDLRRAAGRDRGRRRPWRACRRQRDDDRAGGERERPRRQVHADRGEDRVQAGGERDADADPGARGEQADR